MKCVRCPNHTLQHDTRQKSPTASTVTVRPSIHPVGVAPLWEGAAVAEAETLYICMKKTCYEYEVCVGSKSYVTFQPHGKTKWITHHPLPPLTVNKHTSGWGCILMTTSHCSRFQNTLYMYEADLLWVGTGYGASIITYSIIPVPVRISQISRSWDCHAQKALISVGLHPYDH